MAVDRNTPEAKAARAESRLAALMRGRRGDNARRVKVPLRNRDGALVYVEIQFFVLSQTEVGQCRAHAYHYMVEQLRLDPNELVNRDLYQDECKVETLARVMRDPENIETRFAESAQEVRDLFTADERAAIFDLYGQHQAEVDPARAEMTEEAALEIEEHLKKKDARALTELGSYWLSSFMLFMESRQLLSPIPRSKPSSSSKAELSSGSES